MGKVDRQILRRGQVRSRVECFVGVVSVEIKGFRPVETIEFIGSDVIVQTAEGYRSGEPEGFCGGIRRDGHILHLQCGVACIRFTIGGDLYNGNGSGEGQVDIFSDDKLCSVECKGIAVKLSIDE